MDGTDKFRSHWKIPKSEINKIRKEYETSKEATSKIDPSKLKNFQEMANEVFNHFDKVTGGQRVNRQIMLGNLSYYFDEGFDIPEMNKLISAQYEDDYFRKNPQKFSIANVFPIKDQDRINLAWDALAYFQKIAELSEAVACNYMSEALKKRVFSGDKLAILEDPEFAFSVLPEGDLKAMAQWFMVDKTLDFSMKDYAIRTYSLRKETCDEIGIKCAPLDSIHDILGKIVNA